MFKYLTVAGTFDHFHAGHTFLLNQAFENGQFVYVGITSDAMVQGKKLSTQIEAFEDRKKVVETYLAEANLGKRAEIFMLEDIYGIAFDAGKAAKIEAIVATPDTAANAAKVNEERVKRGLSELEIVTVPLLEGSDNRPISSTRIRLGEIDREGNAYLDLFRKVISAPMLVRDELKSPLGELIAGQDGNWGQAASVVKQKIEQDKPVLTISVGDIVTVSIQNEGLHPDVSFIDNKSRRQIVDVTHSATKSHGPFQNEAGNIHPEVVTQYAKLVLESVDNKTHSQIIIEGEEDLLGLPAVLLAPLGSVVLYGQFDEGIVYLTVTEELKHYCSDVVKRFV